MVRGSGIDHQGLLVSVPERSLYDQVLGFGQRWRNPRAWCRNLPPFAGEFKGKQLFREGKFTGITTVVKAGSQSEGQDYVDGVSGGTLTK